MGSGVENFLSLPCLEASLLLSCSWFLLPCSTDFFKVPTFFDSNNRNSSRSGYRDQRYAFVSLYDLWESNRGLILYCLMVFPLYRLYSLRNSELKLTFLYSITQPCLTYLTNFGLVFPGLPFYNTSIIDFIFL